MSESIPVELQVDGGVRFGPFGLARVPSAGERVRVNDERVYEILSVEHVPGSLELHSHAVCLAREVNPAAVPTSREQRADRYHLRYFVRGGGTTFQCLRGATRAVIHTIAPDGTRDLTDPDELEAQLIAGEIRPVTTP